MARITKRQRNDVRRIAVLGCVLLSAMLAACSFERTFCGTSAIACNADADLRRID